MNHIFHVNNNARNFSLWANFSSMSGGQLQKKLSFKSSWMKRYDTFNLLKKSLNHATGSGLEPVHVS